jgi:RHS repeat-associated protein
LFHYKNWEEQFTFGATGNFANYKQDSNGDGTFDLNQNRVHNKVNEITSIAGSTSYVASDKNGNMTKVVKPDNWSAAYDLIYDAWNRLVQVQDGTTTVATYGYNGLNHRVKKVVDSETRLFYFNDQWQCVEEYVGSTCNIRYVWGLRYVDDLVTYRNASTDYYVLQDANWNVVGLANASGVVQERYTYTSFGKLNIFDTAFIPKTASTFNLTRTFPGQVLDNETGLMLYRNRVYHPALGKFLQRDPIGYQAGDVNLMRYVGNLSHNFTDPQGMWIWSVVIGAISGVVAGGISIGIDALQGREINWCRAGVTSVVSGFAIGISSAVPTFAACAGSIAAAVVSAVGGSYCNGENPTMCDIISSVLTAAMGCGFGSIAASGGASSTVASVATESEAVGTTVGIIAEFLGIPLSEGIAYGCENVAVWCDRIEHAR